MAMDRLENLKNIIMYLMADNRVSHRIPSTLEERQRMMRALMNVWEPRPISEDFLKMQDAELQMQCEDKGVVEISDITPQTSDIRLWQGDITRLKVDAIVNAANAQALGCWAPLHNCIDNCIHTYAGLRLREACFELMKAQGHDEPTGSAKITPAFCLPSKFVIHTVGPIVDGRLTKEHSELLASSYDSCLKLAEENGCESIAFCCISTGVFGFPQREAARVAVDAVMGYRRLSGSRMKVVFNVFKDEDLRIYRELLAKAAL